MDRAFEALCLAIGRLFDIDARDLTELTAELRRRYPEAC